MITYSQPASIDPASINVAANKPSIDPGSMVKPASIDPASINVAVNEPSIDPASINVSCVVHLDKTNVHEFTNCHVEQLDVSSGLYNESNE